MEYLELIRADNSLYKSRFINILKNNTHYTTKELASIYDKLLGSEKVIVYFKSMEISEMNDFTLELAHLDIFIGYASFHEEN